MVVQENGQVARQRAVAKSSVSLQGATTSCQAIVWKEAGQDENEPSGQVETVDNSIIFNHHVR
jgi:hypothetical protein